MNILAFLHQSLLFISIPINQRLCRINGAFKNFQALAMQAAGSDDAGLAKFQIVTFITLDKALFFNQNVCILSYTHYILFITLLLGSIA